jgi:hypothetical protein
MIFVSGNWANPNTESTNNTSFPLSSPNTLASPVDGYTQDELNKAVSDFYKLWKDTYLIKTVDPVDKYYIAASGTGTGTNSVSHSEAHGYGMTIFALMAYVANPIDTKDTKSKTILIENPTSTDEFPLFKTTSDILVTKVTAAVNGTTPSVSVDLGYTTDLDGVLNSIVTVATVTNTEEGKDLTITNSSVVNDRWVKCKLGTVSGTVSYITIQIEYEEI